MQGPVGGFVGGKEVTESADAKEQGIFYKMCFNLKDFWQSSLAEDFLNITSKYHTV